jgi:two-component system OmpR family response regulator
MQLMLRPVEWRRQWRTGDAMSFAAQSPEAGPADHSWHSSATASVRILYVDDEPDIREVVEISLGLDPAFAVRSCASGADALAATADWTPDLVLLDVIMPEMDGPTTLARLRARSRTATVPVVFMTARAQASERDRLLALGAAGVIAKPFDPMTLAALVRRYTPAAETRLAALRDTFFSRVRADAAMLAELRDALAENFSASPNSRGTTQRAVLDQIETIAHNLAEAAGIYGFHYISLDASAIEDAVLAAADPTRALDNFLASLKSEID